MIPVPKYIISLIYPVRECLTCVLYRIDPSHSFLSLIIFIMFSCFFPIYFHALPLADAAVTAAVVVSCLFD